VVIIALTPGTNENAGAANSSIGSGEEVITLWYSEGLFNDANNKKSYQRIKELISKYK